jgi:hypothetical protein
MSLKQKPFKYILLSSLCLTLILILIYQRIIQAQVNKTKLYVQATYYDAEILSDYYFDKIDTMVTLRGIQKAHAFSTLLDTIQNKYARQLLTKEWTPDLFEEYDVTIDQQDQALIAATLQQYCSAFDSAFNQPSIIYDDTVSIQFDEAKLALAQLKEMTPENGKVKMHSTFNLNDLNGDEFLMILSEWKYRNADLLNAFKLALEPEKKEICKQVFLNLKAANE